MARARSIKPGFFKNEELCELPPFARLLYAGLWTIADREGRLEDRPKRIKADVFPYDDCKIEPLLKALTDKGFIIRYEVNQHRFIAIPTWRKHQNPHVKEAASIIPAPEEHSASPVQDQHEHSSSPEISGTSRADSLFSDSLNPEPHSRASGILHGSESAREQSELPPPSPPQLREMPRPRPRLTEPEGRAFGERITLPPLELFRALELLRPDEAAVLRLWEQCRSHDPTATAREIAAMACMTYPRPNPRIANPMGLILKTVPDDFANGGSLRLRQLRESTSPQPPHDNPQPVATQAPVGRQA